MPHLTLPVTCNQYDVALLIYHDSSPLVLGNIPVVGSDLAGIEALIGRDVLSVCLLVYDGVARHVSIAFLSKWARWRWAIFPPGSDVHIPRPWRIPRPSTDSAYGCPSRRIAPECRGDE